MESFREYIDANYVIIYFNTEGDVSDMKQLKARLPMLIAATIILLVVFAFITISRTSPGGDTLNASVATTTVELSNGSTYDMNINRVKHTINDKEYSFLAYNDSIPGPTLIVDQGDEITLNVVNNAGEDTTIHPHGINADYRSDGVPGISQDPIADGETYSQSLRFPEAGLFWYHPHIREDKTQALGLYANIIVRPKDTTDWPRTDREEIVMLSDIDINDDGNILYDDERITHTLMGRFGGVQLVNGQSDYGLELSTGEVTRMYLTNASSVRTFRFTLPGAEVKLIGNDNGLYEVDTFVDYVDIAPSERAIVDVAYKSSGEFQILNKNPESETSIGKVIVSKGSNDVDDAFFDLMVRSSVSSEIDDLLSSPPDTSKRLAINMDMPHTFMQSMMGDMMSSGMENGDHEGIEWEDGMPDANRRSDTDNVSWQLIDLDDTTTENFDWSFNQGDVVKITIENSTRTMHPMQHPIHIHGQKFVVASVDGVATTNRVFQDTVQIPVGATYEIVVRMENKGTWLIHCHIPEHMESGMMGSYTVN